MSVGFPRVDQAPTRLQVGEPQPINRRVGSNNEKVWRLNDGLSGVLKSIMLGIFNIDTS